MIRWPRVCARAARLVRVAAPAAASLLVACSADRAARPNLPPPVYEPARAFDLPDAASVPSTAEPPPSDDDPALPAPAPAPARS
jgi:hypothetical protein